MLSIVCYTIFGSFFARKEGRAMENRRRKPQTLTTEQFAAFRARLDEKGNESPPQPESYRMGEIVRGAYPQLIRLRGNGYTLKMLVRLFEEGGVVITIHSLTTYTKNLALLREHPPPKPARTGTVPSPTVELRPGQFQMKADIPL
jgi:hypothetical protein